MAELAPKLKTGRISRGLVELVPARNAADLSRVDGLYIGLAEPALPRTGGAANDGKLARVYE